MAYDEFTNDNTKYFLGAINTMLNTIGQPDLEVEDEIEDVQEAIDARKDLMQVKREVLSSGWDVNTDENYTLPIDLNGYIPIPNNILELSSIDTDLIIRNHMLYSKSAQSTRFTEAQTVTIKWDLYFNSIPQSLRQYITLKAAKRFRDRILGADATQHSFTQEDERDAYMEARRNESETTGANMLSPDYDIERG